MKSPKEQYLLPWTHDGLGKTYNSLGELLNLYASPDLASRVVNTMNLTADFTNEELEAAQEVEIFLEEERNG